MSKHMNEEDLDITADESAEEMSTSPKKGRFYSKMPFIGKLSYFIFLITVLFLPLFISPDSYGLQMEFVKKLLFSAGILTSFVLWLLTRLEDGKIVFPGGGVFWSSLLLTISFLVSSVLASPMGVSLFGLGYENDTFISIILLFLAMFLASTFFDSQKRIFKFFSGLVAVAFVVGAVEVLQIFSPFKLLSGGVLANLIGKWNDVGIFFGMALLLSLVGLEMPSYRNKKKTRKTLWILFALSTVMVTLVNYDLIWAIIGFFALVICIYSLAESGMFTSRSALDEDSEEMAGPKARGFKRSIFRPSFFVVILSILLFLGTNFVGSYLGKYNLFQLEVRPSWQSTVDVAKETMQKNLYFGTGPNTFTDEWSKHKPVAVNNTIFWNTDFNVGFGRIPSYAVTLGVAGLVASILFLLSLLYYGYKALMASFEDHSDQLIIVASLISSFYLWAFSIFYVTDTALLVLTFVTTGIFLASLARAGIIRQYGFSFLDKPRLGFVSVLAIVLLIISVVSGGYMLSRKFNAFYGFQRGLYTFNQTGNIADIESTLNNSIGMDEQDLYYRSLTEIGLIKLRGLLTNPSTLSKDALFQQLQAYLSSAAGSARRATEIDSTNYQNWMSLGKVGETVMPLRDVISGSYELASDSYNKALALSPNNPSIYFSLAQLEVAKGNNTKAKDYLAQALAKKSNYTEALFLMSQIEAKQGNLANAISKAEQAAVFSPGDVGILFQLGLLKYMSRDYAGSVDALNGAINVQPNYSNAKYFLGLSYSKLGQEANAIKQFEDILVLNPDSKEVQTILRNLHAGRGALDSVVPPKNEPVAPEKRSKLPLKEKTVKVAPTPVVTGN